MCGRYTIFSEEEIIEMNAIIAEVSRLFGEGAIKSGEIFPTNIAPVLTLEAGELSPVPVSWGFPKWDGKGVIINARSESALQKPMFSKPLMTRRCVIPSTGFYEWTLKEENQHEQMSFLDGVELSSPNIGKKLKLHFRLPGELMLYMAGIISTHVDAKGNPHDFFCILTTEAKHTIARFHSRMPVIITQNERAGWIESDTLMREVLTREGPNLEWSLAG